MHVRFANHTMNFLLCTKMSHSVLQGNNGWLPSRHYLFDFCLAFIKAICYQKNNRIQCKINRKHPTSAVGYFSFALKIVIHRRLSILSRAHYSGSSSAQGTVKMNLLYLRGNKMMLQNPLYFSQS